MCKSSKYFENQGKTNGFSFLVVGKLCLQCDKKMLIRPKAYQKDKISPKVLKENADVVSRFLKDDTNLKLILTKATSLKI